MNRIKKVHIFGLVIIIFCMVFVIKEDNAYANQEQYVKLTPVGLNSQGYMVVSVGERIVLAVDIDANYNFDAVFTWCREDGEVLYSSKNYEDYVIKAAKTSDICNYKLFVDLGTETKVVEFIIYKDPNDVEPEVNNITTISTVARTDKAVKIKWNEVINSSEYELRYAVFRYVDSKWKLVGTTSNTSYTFTNLEPSKIYTVAVRPYVIYKVENVWAKSAKAIRIFTLPSNVKKFVASKVAYSAIRTSWTKEQGAEGYVLYRAIGGKWVRVGTTKSNYYTYIGLRRNTAYRLAIRPYSKINNKVVYSSKLTVINARTLR